MWTTRPWALLALLLSTLAAAVTAQVTTLGTEITYQGRLTDNGVPVTGTKSMTFGLYEQSGGANPPLASVTQPAVPVLEGLFTTRINFGTSIDGSSQKYLGVSIEGEPELTPRVKLTATPGARYAVAAGTAGLASNSDRLDGLDSADFAPAAHTHSQLAASDGTPSNAVVVDAAGRVGIGVPVPAAGLDVAGTMKVAGLVQEPLRVDGDLRIGPAAADWPLAVGAELRALRGSVTWDGATGVIVREGEGYTATRLGVGLYEITFTTPFSDNVVAVASSDVVGVFVNVNVLDESYVRFGTRRPNGSTSEQIDAAFCFVVVGPR